MVLGGIVTFLAAILAGATGFGYALMSAPLLLLLGFKLEFVVTVNLTISAITRIAIVYRLWEHITVRRVALLLTGSVPGLYVGTRVLTSIDASTIKFATGILVIIATLLLIRTAKAPPPRPIPGAPVVAGFAGGVLGATTSLSGVPPVLLLTRDRTAPFSFIADLALFFVISNMIGLTLLALSGAFEREALFPAAILWLPGAMLGNFLGMRIASRTSPQLFRYITYAVTLTAGLMTTLSA